MRITGRWPKQIVFNRDSEPDLCRAIETITEAGCCVSWRDSFVTGLGSKPVLTRTGLSVLSKAPKRSHGFEWDGRSIALVSGSRLRPSRDVVHDFAHWLIAPNHRRRLRDFGLGASNSGGSSRQVVTNTEANADEYMASLLGILIEMKLDHNWKDTVDDHSWERDVNSVRTCQASVCRFKILGLVGTVIRHEDTLRLTNFFRGDNEDDR